ncbi:hypothetical protein, partial [Nostoc sp. CCY 9925]|uniref:hypothetical protein n=1 Tax=Nostoc sp. CCY 9925 TaxID=3103865 RepID=UPI0039C66052
MPTTQSITVKRTENLGNYSNRVMEETILLNEGEDPDEERRKLSLKIERSLHEDTRQQVREEIRELREEKSKLNSELRELREQIRKYKTVLEIHQAFVESAGDILKTDFDDNTTTESDVDSFLDPENKSDLAIDTYDDDDGD